MRAFWSAALSAAVLMISTPATATTYWLMDFYEGGCWPKEIEREMKTLREILPADLAGVRVESFFDGKARVLRVVMKPEKPPSGPPWARINGSTLIYTSSREHCLDAYPAYLKDAQRISAGDPLTIGHDTPMGVIDMTDALLRSIPYVPPPEVSRAPRGTITLKANPASPPSTP